MIKHLTIALLAISTTSQAQTIILEENFTSGIPATWSVFDEDGLTPEFEVSEFTSAWIGTIIGSDTVAASTSYYNPTGAANDYLVTPKISLGNFSRLLWSARSVDASYPDGYQVLISTTDSLPASFTDTLMTVDAETAYQSDRGVELDFEGYSNQDVFIAFKNNTENGYILLIDKVKVLGAEVASSYDIMVIPTISIYPNPTADFLNIDSPQEIISYTIYSTTGQIMMTEQNVRIDISTFNSGLYHIQIETIEGIENHQFIKQ